MRPSSEFIPRALRESRTAHVRVITVILPLLTQERWITYESHQAILLAIRDTERAKFIWE
jgi:hypothetical protein